MGVKVAIVGSRNYARLERVAEYIRELSPDTVVISGGARGVDQAAAFAARAHGLIVEEILPDYARFGRYRAPKERNSLIAFRCDRMVAFWDGQSGGTWDVIEKADILGKPIERILL